MWNRKEKEAAVLEYNRGTLSEGLYLMYLGGLIVAVGLVATLLLFMLPVLRVLSLVSAIAALIGAIISVVGLYKMRHLHPDYMSALLLLGLQFVIKIVSRNQINSVVLDMILILVSLVELYFLIRATNFFLDLRGREDMVKMGNRVLFFNIASSLVSSVLNMFIPKLVNSVEELFGIIILPLVISLVVTWYQLSYMKKSAEALR